MIVSGSFFKNYERRNIMTNSLTKDFRVEMTWPDGRVTSGEPILDKETAEAFIEIDRKRYGRSGYSFAVKRGPEPPAAQLIPPPM